MELYHYGVDNQKWGVRRYQNPDGTYTPLGLLRKREKYSVRRRDISSSTDDELREATRRAKLEADYYDAAVRANRDPVSDFWSDIAKKSISSIITTSAKNAGVAGIRSILAYDRAFNNLNEALYGNKDKNK